MLIFADPVTEDRVRYFSVPAMLDESCEDVEKLGSLFVAGFDAEIAVGIDVMGFRSRISRSI